MPSDIRSDAKTCATEKSLFLDALEIPIPTERAKFVEAASRGDSKLAAAVAALLHEHDKASNPIDQPLRAGAEFHQDWIDSTDALSPDALACYHPPGTRIGPYKLMEQIGEGGFGLVFVADQQEPVRRRVALKIIKPGMESREVLNRFEAERQAIALMDHPNIARVFDAGETEKAQPYFVMELVRGVPLIEFCDNHKLSITERLRLFVAVCYAVQHAHQKGIIHRDLKPTNILVTLHDGQPIPKVIDFGVAKAIGQSLTVKTLYTRFASMVGTPTYMSPEQAEMSAGDVDTRSDIYSLGVLLYQLLTGETPFTPERLQSAGLDELRRIIREEEPPRPSTRLSTLNNELASTVAVNRRLDPAKLSTSMKRDLDWIVMKSLDKDRNRRYSTAGALAEDVDRFLADEPIEARPPSTWYRFSKFARRNKVAISTVSMVAGALILGTVVSVWLTLIAFEERDEKELALQQARAAENSANTARLELEEFIERLNSSNMMMASGRAHADADRWPDAYRSYTEATEVQPKYFLVWLERGRLNAKLGRWHEAASDFFQAIEMGCPVNKSELAGVPQLLLYTGNQDVYQQLSEQMVPKGLDEDRYAVAVRGRFVGEVSKETAREIAKSMDESISRTRSKSRFGRGFFGVTLYIAGWAHLHAGNHERAIELLTESHQSNWFGQGIAYPLIAIANHRLGRGDEALEAFAESEAFFDRKLDEAIERSDGSPSMPWIDWIEFLIHYREASIVIKGHTPAVDPRLRQLETFAQSIVVD